MSTASCTRMEHPFLKEMFYVSLFVPPGAPPYPKAIIEKPELARYYQNWGNNGDYCLVACDQETPVGAVWIRFFSTKNRGYGFVAERIPEMGIALQAKYRKQGIGTALLGRMIDYAKKEGIPGLSLSVDKRNDAIYLYQKCGFQIHHQEEDSYTMVLYLNNSSNLPQSNS